ncbi:DUF4352 domain-containing protein [Streptomyces luteoverticillatus]|uniref:DUF4352 domain-containing protein n=1 Tax=Streptomyces luteoverticillatus TaxID=66425 RepID=A0A3Q9G037_STRLT|nr:DUF4352 domain-containing protein [Streptomyces luteoverticillatus]AZQ74680.1 DUF4352 domain-containing protein [Streptomyces luteoverticillatus]
MRRQLSTAAIVIALAATATACNSDGVDAKPDNSASQGAVAPDPGKGGADKGADKGAGAGADKGGAGQDGGQVVGNTVTIKAKNGAQLAVTLKNFADPAQSDNKFMKPSAGKRWVAAQLEIVNTGKEVYDDSPANGVKVTDEAGQAYTHSIGSTTAGANMPATVKLSGGQKALGYVVVSMPENAKVKTISFTPDSGFAKETAEWTIKK